MSIKNMLKFERNKKIVKMFAKFFEEESNFHAVVKTSKKVDKGRVLHTKNVLSDFGIIHNLDEIIYDEDKLSEVLNVMENEYE